MTVRGFAAVAMAVWWVSLPNRGDAQQPTEPILHEYFVVEDVELPPTDAPAGEQVPGPAGEPVHSAAGEQLPGGFEPDRPGARNAPDAENGDLRLDRDTNREGWLTYYAVFEPTIAPYKRVGSRDRVVMERSEIALAISDESLRAVPLDDGAPAAESDAFRGSVLVELAPELAIPIPSVSPEMVIHAYSTAPPVRLTFFRDGADNYLVRGDHAGLVRLEYSVSAPRTYFGGPLASNATVEDVPRRQRPDVPDAVRGPAAELAAHLGLDMEMPMAELVWNLAGYFRAFEAEAFPPEQWTEDIYRDILFGGRGVCRHRTFAFVVTAQAWGIPARYIYNEAHTFAEVFLPGAGWRRVDLGGGAEGLHVLNAAERVLHAPAEADPFPSPPGFEQEYSRAALRQLAEERSAGAEREAAPRDQAPRDQAPSEQASAESAGQTERREEQDPLGLESISGLGAEMEEGVLESLPEDPAEPGDTAHAPVPEPATIEPAAPVLVETRLSLANASREVFRGEVLWVDGTLSDETSTRLAGRSVAVYLGPTRERDTGRVVELGVLETDAQGRVAGRFVVPHSLPLGVWGVYLVFAGDQHYAPSRSP